MNGTSPIWIKRIRLKNYRIFLDVTIDCNQDYNIFVGDNGSGKSSIIHGIDLALSGNPSKVVSTGLKNLFNTKVIADWMKSPKVGELPILTIELFFELPNEPKMNRFFGEHYLESNGKSAFGLKMECKPNRDFLSDIQGMIDKEDTVGTFPFEFYVVEFRTFADQSYTSYLKPFRYLFVDNTTINSTRALRSIVEDTFRNAIEDNESELLASRLRFRQHAEEFKLPEEAVKRDLKVAGDLDSCLEIVKDGISLSDQGDGRIAVCKTESAISRHIEKSSVIAIEEPENHLSHSSLCELISKIKSEADKRQLFIVTHNSYITSRIGLRKVFFVNNGVSSLRGSESGSGISEETARFFMKAPNDNILQFVLSKKILLVEGAAEFILMEKFIGKITSRDAAALGIWVIALNNLSFRRYLELGRVLRKKVAVVRDNDGTQQQWYKDFCNDQMQVFVDGDVNRYTFEVCLFKGNEENLRKIFEDEPDVQDFLLKHKAEAAFRVLEADAEINPPKYIVDAVEWLSKD